MIKVDRIRITTLSENSVADIEYIAEWGFSVHLSIEDGPSILFDTGNGHACTFNARVAGIRLSDVEMIVLSHGHTDHTAGLRDVLQRIRNERPERNSVDIYCHPDAIESQHVRHTDKYFYRGCPFSLEELDSLGARFRTSREPVWLGKDIVISGEVPMNTDFESVAPICFLKTQGHYARSDVADDQALFLVTDRGLIVILGCAHRGMINTLFHARDITGVNEIYMVIGGSHLMNTSVAQQTATLRAIQQLDVRAVGVSHCTGMRPASFLCENLGPKKFFFNNAGTMISFKDDRINISSFEKNQL